MLSGTLWACVWRRGRRGSGSPVGLDERMHIVESSTAGNGSSNWTVLRARSQSARDRDARDSYGGHVVGANQDAYATEPHMTAALSRGTIAPLIDPLR